MARFILFIVIFLLQTAGAQSQSNCDCPEAESLRQPMSLHFNSGRFDSARFYTERLLQFSTPACRIYYLNWMAQIAFGQKLLDSASRFLNEEEMELKALHCDQHLYVRHYNTLARLYQEKNLIDSFVAVSLSGIRAAETVGDYFGLSRTSADLATAFAEMDQTEKAIYYYRKALDAASKQNKVPVQGALVAVRLAKSFLSRYSDSAGIQYADSAQWLARQALDTANKYHDLLTYLEANETLAKHSIATGELTRAENYANDLLSHCPKGVHLFDRLLYGGFAAKADVLLQRRQYSQAEQLADSALFYASAFNPQIMIGALNRVYRVAGANGHPEKSLAAFEKMTALRDSLFSLKKNATISELEKKYNQAKNESTIIELSRRKQLYLLLAIAGLIAAVAIGLYFRQRVLQQRKTALEAEQRLNRARMNPHFFFNALAALQKFALKEEGGQALATQLSRFSYIMRESLESTYQDFTTVEKEIAFLEEYLSIQAVRFPDNLSFAIRADEELEVEEVLLPSMILQPFVENSIEHGFSEGNANFRIEIAFSKQADELLVEIKDNGKGLSLKAEPADDHISRATQILRDRFYLLNQTLKAKARFAVVNADQGMGVSVSIRLPLLYKKN